CGQDVGLPDGQIGNSEVGHMNIGAGRVVWQDLLKITQSIEKGELADNSALTDYAMKLSAGGGTCHLMGLVSPGGVHAHEDHIIALAKQMAAAGIRTCIHAFTDGRDTAPKSAAKSLATLSQAIEGLDGVEIATVIGRYFAMDRDKRWERVEKAYQAIKSGVGTSFDTPHAAIEAAYGAGTTDEFVEPAIIGSYSGMKDGDGILFANFRADRARQILSAFLDPGFDGFAAAPPTIAAACGMVEYSEAHNQWMSSLFPPKSLTHVLGQVVAGAGRKQLRLAETEKYPHVTFFLNGGEEAEFDGEDRIMVPSPKVATYDLQPEMSAPDVADALVNAINLTKYGLIVVNFANPDMVGHTGDLAAAIKAVETVDACLGRAVDAAETAGAAMLVTADHGNCETMRDPDTGEPHTAHTLNVVPAMLVGVDPSAWMLADGKLADVAPTLLALAGLAQPAAMSGTSLLVPHADASRASKAA
ncbi:MAG: 2,3-bisphosphoglycerate-independent phosphoglycerate mutase, partial [Pseudomonadota bacterium]